MTPPKAGKEDRPQKLVTWLPVKDILPNPHNPRKIFNEAEIVSFGLELKQHGIKDPLRVYQQMEQYSLIAGERRWRACLAVGITEAPAIIEPEPANASALIIDQLVENDAHRSLSPIERGEGYQTLIKLNGWSSAELARTFGKSESDVSRSLAIRNGLALQLQPHVHSGKLPLSLAYELAKVRNHLRQVELAEAVMERGLTRSELIHIIKSEKSRKDGAVQRPIRLARAFDPLKGYEGIRSELSAILAEVQKAEKNQLPLSFLSELLNRKPS